MRENISLRVNENQCTTSICVFQVDLETLLFVRRLDSPKGSKEPGAPDNV